MKPQKNIVKSDSKNIWVYPRFWPSTQIKSIGGRLDKQNKCWKLPFNHATIKRLETLFSESSIEYDETIQSYKHEKHGFKLDNIIIPDNIQGILENYQKESIHYLGSSPKKASLVNLEPGLGKTLTTLSAAKAIEAKRVLIVVGVLSLIETWKYEYKKWFGGELQDAYKSPPPDGGWVVTNIQTATNHLQSYRQKWDVIIFDESIKLKNRKTKAYKTMSILRSFAEYFWLLSGSPTSRFIDDLYAQLSLLDPKAFKSYWRFVNLYCDVMDTPWGTKITGTKSNIDPKDEFKDYMIVINEMDAFGESSLNKMLFEPVYCSMGKRQKSIIDKIRDEFILVLSEDKETEITTKLAQLTRLQQAVSSLINITDFKDSSKLKVLMDLIDNDILPTPSIIWVHWTKTAQQITEALKSKGKKVTRFIGGDPPDNLKSFQNGETDYIVISLGVGKYGHTLSNAKSMVYFDKSWDSDAYVQSIKRVSGGLRGKQNTIKPVVYSLIGIDTIDEYIQHNLGSKLESIARINNTDLIALLRGVY